MNDQPSSRSSARRSSLTWMVLGALVSGHAIQWFLTPHPDAPALQEIGVAIQCGVGAMMLWHGWRQRTTNEEHL